MKICLDSRIKSLDSSSNFINTLHGGVTSEVLPPSFVKHRLESPQDFSVVSIMLEKALQPLLEKFTGQVAIAFQRFHDGSSYLYNAGQLMRSASLIKLPVLTCALEKVARGELSLEQRYELKTDEVVGGAGLLQMLKPGLSLSLYDLLTFMIVVSDNTATNMTIDIVGQNAMNAYMQGLGLSQTKLIGKLQLPENKQNEAQRRGERNSTCAADMLGLLMRLGQRELLPDELTRVAIDILKHQQFTEALSRYLPRDAEIYDDYINVASKSGCLRGLWHDAGIVYDKNYTPLYTLVVMTDGSADESYSWEQEGMMLIANISKVIYSFARVAKV
ncbi:MAG: serine hydrolase [Trueperaceae bacterium]